ncbi:lipopolysaccharide assembly protein LapA domain-containing protein [uncultured Corynebacterium sp.]|uniref:LapA family protein n=1 Tax=uncultured Corynebacterium sp. TaxID=159447 RepID=UPI002615F973|nr:lipopolysaccharide assembly protein LapA domain-containing protein [uncultured Corynebacterium sp.]
MTKANQPNNDRPLFDDAPAYSPNDYEAPAPEQDNLPEPVAESQAEKESAPASAPAPAPGPRKVKKTTAGSMWVGLVISAILLIVLLVFILQNQQETALNLFGWTWNFPVGVGMLFAAILGALITALIGGWRMLDLRRQIRKGDN